MEAHKNISLLPINEWCSAMYWSVSIHVAVFHRPKESTHLLLLSVTLHGMEYPPGWFRPAALPMSLPPLLPSPCWLWRGWRESWCGLSSRHNPAVIPLLLELHAQSTALHGLLQAKLTSRPAFSRLSYRVNRIQFPNYASRSSHNQLMQRKQW